MAVPESETGRRRLLLFYAPRSAHHLFMRILSGQKDLQSIEVVSYYLPDLETIVHVSSMESLDDHVSVCESLQRSRRRAFNEWTEQMAAIEASGKRILNSYSAPFCISPAVRNQWVRQWNDCESINMGQLPRTSPSSLPFWQVEAKRTSSNNPTYYPDDFLRSHQAVLLIRHPLLAFPSTIRTASSHFGQDLGRSEPFLNYALRYKWHRLVYEWYKNDAAADDPIVLDADNVMYDPGAVKLFCERTGLSVTDLKYEWEKTGLHATYKGEDTDQILLINSTGVVAGKSSEGLDIDTESKKWVEEFGERTAQSLRKLVKDAMSDYTFLRSKSLSTERLA